MDRWIVWLKLRLAEFRRLIAPLRARWQRRTWLRSRKSQIIVIGIFLATTIPYGVSKYAESPAFCQSCHIMEPYYNAWKTSKHNFVACVDCHYPPESLKNHLYKKFQALSQVAKYVTRTYSSKPYAEIEDSSCLRSGCHSTRLLEGRVQSKRGIKFDHRPHLTGVKRGRKLRCVSCHSQMVVGNHVEVTYNTCYLCHFRDHGEGRHLEPIGGCLGCHDLPKGKIKVGNMEYSHKEFVVERGLDCTNCHLDVVRGSGKASPERCYTCHNEPEKLEKYSETAFIHENHVTNHNVACIHCHDEIQHSFGGEKNPNVIGPIGEPTHPKSAQVKTPMAHMPTLSFDCSFCHENKHGGQLQMYSGKTEGMGLPVVPSPMYLAHVDCIGCHYVEESDPKAVEFSGTTFTASPKACIKCHGEAFLGIFDETKTALQSTLTQLEQKAESVRKAVAGVPEPTETQAWAQEKIAAAMRMLQFVRTAHGEHNIYLASVVFRQVDTMLKEVGERLALKLNDLSALPLLSGSYCATMCHTKVNVDVPPETVEVDGKTMPHRLHTTMMSCVDCHNFGAHKEVPLQPGARELCQGCHPE